MKPAVALAAAALLLAQAQAPAGAQALALPPPPAARFEPVPGTRLPSDAMLRDDAGRTVRLDALSAGRPLVLVPGYYTWPNLCSTVFEGVLQELELSGLAAGEYRLAGLSVDPHDGAATAATRKRAYAALLSGGAADLVLLTGDATTLARVQAALGYRAVPDATGGELAHAAGFVVLDAQGRITRYFPGVRFDPGTLRDAVRAAARSGAAPAAPALGPPILLQCAHNPPPTRPHPGTAQAIGRAGVLALPLLLAGWLWRRRGRRA